LEKLPPATVINLNRGEEAADFALHRRIIEIQNRNSSRYIYASSFNAVDAELSRPHHENDPAASQSVYGKFKARCEQELLKTCGRPLAFRFAATHGWAPNRMARTQEFLEKLRKGENIIVTKGILQNRSFVGDLAEQIATLSLADQAQGIFHLGTSDFSEEIDFLKKMAQAFGYDASQVIAGEANQCNAVMLMERLPSLLSHGDALPTEAETISKVSSQLELASYRKGSS
ncbi:MAG: sugar nucleotide-binding protein, partial [Bdellovibrionota bacterium]